MALFTHPEFDGHETVVFAQNGGDGLRTIIAVHDTTLGPALGGCRVWNYADEAEALTDVLRLSRSMSYKAALAGLPLGGGKSVVLADSRRDKTEAMMRAMGRAVERLGGRYIVAEDVGVSVADMDAVATETRHVAGTTETAGDPSPHTARGVCLSIEAAARRRLGRGLDGLEVTVLGLGHVGARLAAMLAEAGARLAVADIRPEAVAEVARTTGARGIGVDEAHQAEADVFAPCALGAGLNARTIPEIGAQIVCGAANNQLAQPGDDRRLAEAGILYCPDYLVNAGGLISVARGVTGDDDAAIAARVEGIPATLKAVIERAETEDMPPGAAADSLARSRIEEARRA
ncbi:MAG: Glu/Leu/Phe/Val dehydrogenase dimerization domain-containing protein [Pseudomonadota bacterium]